MLRCTWARACGVLARGGVRVRFWATMTSSMAPYGAPAGGQQQPSLEASGSPSSLQKNPVVCPPSHPPDDLLSVHLSLSPPSKQILYTLRTVISVFFCLAFSSELPLNRCRARLLPVFHRAFVDFAPNTATGHPQLTSPRPLPQSGIGLDGTTYFNTHKLPNVFSNRLVRLWCGVPFLSSYFLLSFLLLLSSFLPQPPLSPPALLPPRSSLSHRPTHGPPSLSPQRTRFQTEIRISPDSLFLLSLCNQLDFVDLLNIAGFAHLTLRISREAPTGCLTSSPPLVGPPTYCMNLVFISLLL